MFKDRISWGVLRKFFFKMLVFKGLYFRSEDEVNGINFCIELWFGLEFFD